MVVSPKLGVPFWESPEQVLWGLYWGLLVLGSYYMELFKLEPRAILGLFGSYKQLQTGALALALGFRVLSRFDSGAHEGMASFPVVFVLFWGLYVLFRSADPVGSRVPYRNQVFRLIWVHFLCCSEWEHYWHPEQSRILYILYVRCEYAIFA